MNNPIPYPGGILGVVEHRAKPGISIKEMKKSGYITEELTINLAEEAGFIYQKSLKSMLIVKILKIIPMVFGRFHLPLFERWR